MEHDQVELAERSAELQSRLLRHVRMRGSVETVAADAVGFVPILRDRIPIGAGWNALVEGGVEDGDLGNVRSAGHRYLDAQEVGWVVQGRERGELPNGLDHPFVDHAGVAELFAAVNDSMSDADELAAIFRYTAVAEQAHDSVEGGGVIPERAVGDLFVERPRRIPLSVNESAARLADPLCGSVRQQGALAHLEELILDRRASGVENQNPHDSLDGVWAWMAVTATVFTMSGTVHPRLRSLTGFFRP